MSIHSPLWLLALLALPPLVLLTLRALRRQAERFTARRAAVFLLLRAAALLLLVLGLAGFALARLSDRLSIVFLLDQSRSVSAESGSARSASSRRSAARLGSGDSAVLVRFGAAAGDGDAGAGVPVPEEGGEVDPGATNIGAALQDGAGPGGRRPAREPRARIVLLTDGNENRGSADAAAGVAKSMGARIFPLPLGAPVRGGRRKCGGGGARPVSGQARRGPRGHRHGAEPDPGQRPRDAAARRGAGGDPRGAACARRERRAVHRLVPRARPARVGCPGGGAGGRRSAEQPQPTVRGGERRAAGALRRRSPGRSSPSLLSALAAQGISVVSAPGDRPSGDPGGIPARTMR